jgi:hypothetical protein
MAPSATLDDETRENEVSVQANAGNIGVKRSGRN